MESEGTKKNEFPKLPKEVQEIIKFWYEHPVKNIDDMTLTFGNMIFELSPLFEDDASPGDITEKFDKDALRQISEQLRNERINNAVTGLSKTPKV